MKIVGIGGLPRSGKDTVAELLIEAGYFGISFGDVVRGFAQERHKGEADPISVANMTKTSNWLRQTHGADVILQEALRQFKDKQAAGQKYKGLVLWSVRAPVEVDFILEHGGEMIWVEASDDVRHARNLKHLRAGEAAIDLTEFQRQEALQWQPQPGMPADVQMNLSYVKAKATQTLENNGDDKDEFLQKVQDLISAIDDKI